MVTSRIGIMQGRLLPRIAGRIQAFPGTRWPDEFAAARAVGFGAIEFVFDDDPKVHPLMTAAGRRNIANLVQQSGVLVEAVCADHFMSHPLHAVEQQEAVRAVEVLCELLRAAGELRVRTVVLPCIDDSSLRSHGDMLQLIERLVPLGGVLRDSAVRLALETDLPPHGFAWLLEQLPEEIGVNYDMGNSASLGFDPEAEFDAYGRRVISVHVKDRRLRGPTVPLGTGQTNFAACFRRLAGLCYNGPLTIQGARGDDDVKSAAQYLEFVRAHVPQATS